MKRKVQLWTICLAVVLLVQSCKSKNNEKQSSGSTDSLAVNTEDSVQLIHDFSLEDGEHIFKINTQQWLKSTLKNNKADWKNFSYKSIQEIDTLSDSTLFKPAKDFYKNYQSVLRWSLDSNFIIDFGSYGSMAIKDDSGNTRLEGSDPDTKVSLINVKEQRQSQLLFAGPSTKIIDVKWLSSTEAVMLFSEQAAHNECDTLLWFIDVPRNQIRQYQYQ
ncbi:hypothetical protein [Arachidicoccus sp.]|uniref:hypothetical protein n=1 Tax=Arachidicoccus sp. TaxID=1872624 RepID=UPI003D2271A4